MAVTCLFHFNWTTFFYMYSIPVSSWIFSLSPNILVGGDVVQCDVDVEDAEMKQQAYTSCTLFNIPVRWQEPCLLGRHPYMAGRRPYTQQTSLQQTDVPIAGRRFYSRHISWQQAIVPPFLQSVNQTDLSTTGSHPNRQTPLQKAPTVYQPDIPTADGHPYNRQWSSQYIRQTSLHQADVLGAGRSFYSRQISWQQAVILSFLQSVNQTDVSTTGSHPNRQTSLQKAPTVYQADIATADGHPYNRQWSSQYIRQTSL